VSAYGCEVCNKNTSSQLSGEIKSAAHKVRYSLSLYHFVYFVRYFVTVVFDLIILMMSLAAMPAAGVASAIARAINIGK